MWMMKTGEGHGVGNGLDRVRVDVVDDDLDKMPARVRRPRLYNK